MRTKITPVPRAYQRSTKLLALVLCGLGLAMVVLTLSRGGGPLSMGVVIGASFAVYGTLRLVISRRTSSPSPRA